MRSIKEGLFIIFVLLLIGATNINTYAEEKNMKEGFVIKNSSITRTIGQTSEETNSDSNYFEENALVQIKLVYVDASGRQHLLKCGTGFFFGADSTYILTGNKNVSLSEEEKNNIALKFGVESSNLNFKTLVVLKSDIEIEATIANSSNEMDFAILTVSGMNGSVTKLRLSENLLYEKESEVYTLGISIDADGKCMTIVADGHLIDWVTLGSLHYYKHDIVTSSINYGGPLMDEKGEVIGLNVTYTDGYYYSLQISEITEVLDALGIIYNSAYLADTNELQELIEEYEKLQLSKYTEETVSDCKVAYENAKAIIEDVRNENIDIYTQNRINEAAIDLNLAMEKLIEKTITITQVIVISVVVFVLLLGIIIFLIISLIRKKKKYIKEINEEKNKKITAEDALRISGRITPGDISANSKSNTYLPFNKSLASVNAESFNQMTNNDFINSEGSNSEGLGISNFKSVYAPETTVLNTENYSTVLSGPGKMISYPVIIRAKTGDRIRIDKSNFIIGKDVEQVDYYIPHNSNISRRHACVRKMQDGYYVQDLGSTNGTFIDGIKVRSDRDVKLCDGSIIRIADEEFEFKL